MPHAGRPSPIGGDRFASVRQTDPTGLLHHIAFSCTGLAEMRARLQRSAIRFEERVLPRDRQTQIFLHDPDGVAVELNYPPEETAAA